MLAGGLSTSITVVPTEGEGSVDMSGSEVSPPRKSLAQQEAGTRVRKLNQDKSENVVNVDVA